MSSRTSTMTCPACLASPSRQNPYNTRNSQKQVQITLAQRHADAGVPVDVLRELMDHRLLDTTKRYYNSRELHQLGEKPQVSRSQDRRNDVPLVVMPAL